MNMLFYSNIFVNYTILSEAISSIVYHPRRIWQPPRKWSWQYMATWLLIFATVTIEILLAFLTWDTWVIPLDIRLFFGIPISTIGGMLALWGILKLGIVNTYEVRDEFITKGPFQFTHNPQYLSTIVLFIGLSLIVNSSYAAIPLLLFATTLFITLLWEEPWLYEQYGDEYVEYKNSTLRFL